MQKKKRGESKREKNASNDASTNTNSKITILCIVIHSHFYCSFCLTERYLFPKHKLRLYCI